MWLSRKPHERLKRAHIRAQGASSHTRKHRADEAPLGTTADAFYQKGSGVKSLLKLLDSVPEPGSILPKQPMVPPPKERTQRLRRGSGHHRPPRMFAHLSSSCRRFDLQDTRNGLRSLQRFDSLWDRGAVRMGASGGLKQRFSIGPSLDLSIAGLPTRAFPLQFAIEFAL